MTRSASRPTKQIDAVASRRRALGEVPEPCSPEGAQDLGLFENDDGSPVRLRRNGRQPKAVGLYFSVKSGLHLPYESKLELHDLWRAEVCTEVFESRPQPFTMRFMMDGEVHRYTPDRKDLRAGGAADIVEVKDDGEGDSEHHDVIRSLLAERGMAFHVRRRAQIEAEPSFTAVETVQRNRRARVLVGDVLSVGLLLAGGPAPLNAVLGVLTPGPAGFATVCAMIVRRLIAIDLSQGLVGGAHVRLV